jgi:hypothetical protein
MNFPPGGEIAQTEFPAERGNCPACALFLGGRTMHQLNQFLARRPNIVPIS